MPRPRASVHKHFQSTRRFSVKPSIQSVHKGYSVNLRIRKVVAFFAAAAGVCAQPFSVNSRQASSVNSRQPFSVNSRQAFSGNPRRADAQQFSGSPGTRMLSQHKSSLCAQGDLVNTKGTAHTKQHSRRCLGSGVRAQGQQLEPSPTPRRQNFRAKRGQCKQCTILVRPT